ncbi:hypothetical protein G6F57_012364 [Rhizopus arrhizus]|nr:hypothetical protein G6F57_012364 [Rhizopus arrhizus]
MPPSSAKAPTTTHCRGPASPPCRTPSTATSHRCCRSWKPQFRTEAAKKYISLNEATRRAERERQDAQRKERQVQRKELGLALDPLADDSSDDGLTGNERDIVKDAAREKAAEKRPDPLLRESASLLADAVNLLANDRPLSAQVLPQSTGAGRWAD